MDQKTEAKKEQSLGNLLTLTNDISTCQCFLYLSRHISSGWNLSNDHIRPCLSEWPTWAVELLCLPSNHYLEGGALPPQSAAQGVRPLL